MVFHGNGMSIESCSLHRFLLTLDLYNLSESPQMYFFGYVVLVLVLVVLVYRYCTVNTFSEVLEAIGPNDHCSF